MEGDEGEHAGVDEEHHEDRAQEPDELGLATPEQARTEIYQALIQRKLDPAFNNVKPKEWYLRKITGWGGGQPKSFLS